MASDNDHDERRPLEHDAHAADRKSADHDHAQAADLKVPPAETEQAASHAPEKSRGKWCRHDMPWIGDAESIFESVFNERDPLYHMPVEMRGQRGHIADIIWSSLLRIMMMLIQYENGQRELVMMAQLTDQIDNGNLLIPHTLIDDFKDRCSEATRLIRSSW